QLGRSENACRYTEMSLREAIVAVIAGSAEANALVAAHAATHAHLLSLGAALSELPAAGLPHSGRNWNSLSRGAELTIDPQPAFQWRAALAALETDASAPLPDGKK